MRVGEGGRRERRGGQTDTRVIALGEGEEANVLVHAVGEHARVCELRHLFQIILRSYSMSIGEKSRIGEG